jgi:hypothetical protein
VGTWLRRQLLGRATWGKISRRVQAERQERRRQLRGKENLAAAIEALLFQHDPIGLNFNHNTDEYRPEAESIVLRLPDAHSVEDVRRIAHEEFVRWFDPQLAGPEPSYNDIAQEIWHLWTAETS